MGSASRSRMLRNGLVATVTAASLAASAFVATRPVTTEAPSTALQAADGASAASEEVCPEGFLPMAEFLALHQPERVRPPTTDFSWGGNASYSNWGRAVAVVGVVAPIDPRKSVTCCCSASSRPLAAAPSSIA